MCFCSTVSPDRQGDCYKYIQFVLCACAGLSFFVERFSASLNQLSHSIYGEQNFGTKSAPETALGNFENQPAGMEPLHRKMAKTTTSNVVLVIKIEVAGDGSSVLEQPVIQIGCVVSHVGCDQPNSQYVFTWKPTAAIAGVDVVVAKDEIAMLTSFSSFIIQSDPDVITGFNVCAFDLKYIIERMQKLQLNCALCIGRLDDSPMRFIDRSAADKEFRFNDGAEVFIPGRAVHDVYQWILNQHQLSGTDVIRAYSLEGCSLHFLQEVQVDLKCQQIVSMFNGNNADRRELAVHCLKDARLTLRLMNLLSKTCPQVERFFEQTSVSYQAAVAPPFAVSEASTNNVTPATRLPPAVLAKIEANKQAALQRRKAAEDSSNATRRVESIALATVADAGCAPAADALPSCAAPMGVNQVWRSAKRHWGVLGAVSDDGSD